MSSTVQAPASAPSFTNLVFHSHVKPDVISTLRPYELWRAHSWGMTVLLYDWTRGSSRLRKIVRLVFQIIPFLGRQLIELDRLKSLTISSRNQYREELSKIFSGDTLHERLRHFATLLKNRSSKTIKVNASTEVFPLYEEEERSESPLTWEQLTRRIILQMQATYGPQVSKKPISQLKVKAPARSTAIRGPSSIRENLRLTVEAKRHEIASKWISLSKERGLAPLSVAFFTNERIGNIALRIQIRMLREAHKKVHDSLKVKPLRVETLQAQSLPFEEDTYPLKTDTTPLRVREIIRLRNRLHKLRANPVEESEETIPSIIKAMWATLRSAFTTLKASALPVSSLPSSVSQALSHLTRDFPSAHLTEIPKLTKLKKRAQCVLDNLDLISKEFDLIVFEENKAKLKKELKALDQQFQDDMSRVKTKEARAKEKRQESLQPLPCLVAHVSKILLEEIKELERLFDEEKRAMSSSDHLK